MTKPGKKARDLRQGDWIVIPALRRRHEEQVVKLELRPMQDAVVVTTKAMDNTVRRTVMHSQHRVEVLND